VIALKTRRRREYAAKVAAHRNTVATAYFPVIVDIRSATAS
jgi:hypothetical protein